MNGPHEDAENRQPDGEGFDIQKVPDGPLHDLFFDGRTGAGLSNEQWDEQRRRMREYGDDPFATEPEE